MVRLHHSIRELSSSSTVGPDGSPCSLLLNCAHELAPSLLILFKQSLSSGVIDPSLKELVLSRVIEQPLVTIDPFQCRRERYIIIYVWKILEGLIPNLFPPICIKTWDCRGRTCITSHISVRQLGTLQYNSFR